MNYELAKKNLAVELKEEDLLDDYEVTQEDGDHCTIETPYGEYLVCEDNDVAYNLAVESAEEILDDMGLEALAPEFRDEIYNDSSMFNAEWFEDAFKDSYESYVDDIEYESDDEYDNRLIHEMADAGIIDENNLHENEDGLLTLNDYNDIDKFKEEFVEKLMSGIDDYVGEYVFQFGEREFKLAVEQNNLADYHAIAEECVDVDGIAHFLASYDDKEIELANGMLAYRTN